jgi:ferredoxin-NADP reductase
MRAVQRTAWQSATVMGIIEETATAKTFRLALSGVSEHLAGQHFIVALSAPDGYRAQRAYSVASAPDGTENIELTVERLGNGEVSSFLHHEVVIGDTLQVRGPIGGWFVWRADCPALLVGGGSGIVPLMSMLRLARRSGHSDIVRLLVSTHGPDDLYYAKELPGPETTVVYTRQVPISCERPPGRLEASDLEPILLQGARVYVCGSSGFVDHVTELLSAIGVATDSICCERFGPTS